jgi:hypothetical protein
MLCLRFSSRQIEDFKLKAAALILRSSFLMPIKVVAITGSLRKASVNAGLLRAAAKIAPQHDMEITIISADLPLFNEDLEEAGPAGAVLEFCVRLRTDRNAIR